MSLAASAVAIPKHLRDKEMVLSLTPTGNYVNGGDTVNLTSIANPKYLGNANVGFPGNIQIWEVINCPVGYSAKLIPGATLATWKLKVLQGGAANSTPEAEIPAAAYPAAILADVFTIRLVGPKGQM
jgi:hypothetical protein